MEEKVIDIVKKSSPISAFPKNKPGMHVFVEEEDKKAEYPCFCINDIYRGLFAGSFGDSKIKAGNRVSSAPIYFRENPHIVKKGEHLLKFLLPSTLFEKIKNSNVKDIDYKEFLLRSTNNNKITRLLFSMFSTPGIDSEKRFVESIQDHFTQILEAATFLLPDLKNCICNLVDKYIAPRNRSEKANTAFHALVDSKEHDAISKAIANIFISAMLGLYSMKYDFPESKRDDKYKFVRTYLLDKLGMEFVWAPETITINYVELQNALRSYECGQYEDAFKGTLTLLANRNLVKSQEKALAWFILGACLIFCPGCCNFGVLPEESKKNLKDNLIGKTKIDKLFELLQRDNSVAYSDEEKKQLRSNGIDLLEKCVSTDNTISEAFFILYSHYDGKNEQKAFKNLSIAYDQTYAKAVIEVANRRTKGQNPLPGLTTDDIIDKLTAIISDEHNYSDVEVSECLYLRGRLRLKLGMNDEASLDFETAYKKGHEKARQELSRKERMEHQRFPSFSDDPNAPCCFANSLNGNNLVFVSTLPNGEWNLVTAEQKNPSVDKTICVKDFDEFVSEQHLENFDSYIHKVIFLFMSEDKNRNLNECLMALDKLFNIALKISEKQRNTLMDNIEIFVDARYEIASTLIDANINDMGNDVFFKVHVVDETRDSAHQLLCDAPLFLPLLARQKHSVSINVVLFGCSETNYRIIKESIGCAYIGKEHPVSISLLGADADRMERRLRQECPGIFHKLNIECIRPKFISCCIEEEDFPSLIYGNAHDECSDSEHNKLAKTLRVGNYFVVDLSNDQDSIRFAMELRTWFLRSKGTFDCTPFICVKCRNSQNSYLASHLTLSGQAAGDTYYSKYDLFPFGIARILYSYNRLVENPRLEEVALQIHKSYYGGNDRLAENDYYSFSYNADSSLLMAIGLSYRLFAGGAYFEQKERYLNYGAFNTTDPDLLDILDKYVKAIRTKGEMAAALEQSRWNGFMMSRGWESADLNQVRAYKDQSTGISHKHTLAKLHPFIRDWEDLDSDDIIQILKMLRSKFDYNKQHPKSTTRKNIKDTPRFLRKPGRNEEKTH